MPRFVILEHDHPTLHWDLMLEADGVLKTWRLARPPLREHASIAATKLADHRLAYLDYEGPVSGDRGTVTRWDRGVYVTEQALDASRLMLELKGDKVTGWMLLSVTAGDEWVLAWAASSD